MTTHNIDNKNVRPGLAEPAKIQSINPLCKTGKVTPP
jgi:hypothetical protein